jgi:predicted flap endonuclease-1-like 5' DNA nuclease
MRYVFGEILPWIVGVALLGFVLGWLFWRCWTWLRPKEHREGEATRLTGRIGDLEANNRRLEAEAEALRAKVADYASLQAEAASLRAKIAKLEARSAAGVAAPFRAKPAAKVASTPAAAKPAAAKPAAAKRPAAPRVLDLTAAASVLGSKIKLDDLTMIEGIGPQIAGLLNAAGITTWSGLSKARVPALTKVLDDAGPRFRRHDPATWPEQSRLLTKGAWAEFTKLTDSLKAGRH